MKKTQALLLRFFFSCGGWRAEAAFDCRMLKAAVPGGDTPETDQDWQSNVNGDDVLDAFDDRFLKYAVMNDVNFS